MAESLRWGILATGGIAHQFAGGVKVSKTGTLQAVGSRTLESATKFTDKHGGTPYGSYEEVLADPNVDAVYIALPHHMHMDWTIKTAEAGKGILCEKPFTLNALEAERAISAVEKAGVFFMEAFMYRCAPQTLKIKELVHSGAIGKIRAINAEFAFGAAPDWKNFRTDAAVGAGGLMDVGTYCVSMCRLITGEEPSRCEYLANLEYGYDAYGSGALQFPGGVTAHFGTGIHLNMSNLLTIYGEGGHIVVDQPWKCGGGLIHVHASGQAEATYDLACTNDELYGFEADAVAEFFEAKQCPHMSIADTINNMKTLDALRKSAGLHFAAELTE